MTIMRTGGIVTLLLIVGIYAWSSWRTRWVRLLVLAIPAYLVLMMVITPAALRTAGEIGAVVTLAIFATILVVKRLHATEAICTELEMVGSGCKGEPSGVSRADDEWTVRLKRIESMILQTTIMPEQASQMAWHVDNLIWFISATCGITGLGVYIALLYFCIVYRRKEPNQLGFAPDATHPGFAQDGIGMDGHAAHPLPGVLCLGCLRLQHGVPRAAGRSGDLRRRQAVDVEDSVPRRAAA